MGHSSSTSREDSSFLAPEPPLRARPLFRLAAMVPHRWLMKVASLQYRFPVLKPALQAAARNFRNQDAIMQAGIGRGLKFNTGGSIAGYAVGIAEPDMQAALRTLVRPGMVAYDIGANVGFFSVLMARLVGSNGQVISFEPVPENARQIRYNARLNGFTNIQVETVAVGDREGTAAFRVTDFSTTGKLCSASGAGPISEEITVPTRRLDAMVAKGDIPSASLIKIDVEGAETALLQGADETLRKTRPILLIELHNTHNDVISILEQRGYTAHVLGSPMNPSEGDWNCRIAAAPRELDGLAALIPRLTDPRRMS